MIFGKFAAWWMGGGARFMGAMGVRDRWRMHKEAKRHAGLV